MSEMLVQKNATYPPHHDGHDYTLFGWRVHSDGPFPELAAWDGDPGHSPDIRICNGDAAPLEGAVHRFGPLLDFTDSTFRFVVPEIATYRLDGQRDEPSTITIAPAVGMTIDSPEVRLFFFGTVLAALCYRRGLIPLHASAIDINGRALLLSGPSGIGKSTLAATFYQHGYPLLSDDLCALDVSIPGSPTILPCLAYLKLWQDAARHLAIPTGPLEPVREGQNKFKVPIPSTARQRMALRQVVLLRRIAQPDDGGLFPLRGSTALRQYDLFHRPRLGIAMGYQADMLLALAAVAQHVSFAELRRQDDLSALPALARLLLAQEP